MCTLFGFYGFLFHESVPPAHSLSMRVSWENDFAFLYDDMTPLWLVWNTHTLYKFFLCTIMYIMFNRFGVSLYSLCIPYPNVCNNFFFGGFSMPHTNYFILYRSVLWRSFSYLLLCCYQLLHNRRQHSNGFCAATSIFQSESRRLRLYRFWILLMLL